MNRIKVVLILGVLLAVLGAGLASSAEVLGKNISAILPEVMVPANYAAGASANYCGRQISATEETTFQRVQPSKNAGAPLGLIKLSQADVGITFGIICPFAGANASIPAGWTRETLLDGFYVKGALAGADADMTDSNGASTHTHTAPSTTIVQNSHTHTFSAGAGAGTQITDAGAGTTASTVAHIHSSKASSSTTATNQATTPTINANSSNDLNYVTVIWIRSLGTPTGLDANILAFYASDSLPSGWSRTDRNLYLKGAAGGADANSFGGSNTHTHTGTIQPTQDGHAHVASNSNAGTGSSAGLPGGITVAKNTHTHSVLLDSNTATNQLDTNTSNSKNHEPPYLKLNTIINTGSTSFPTGVICLWNGADTNIPANWTRVHDLDTKFVKGANVNGDSNVETGGSSTHTHDINFLVTQNPHSHPTVINDIGMLTTDMSADTGDGTAATTNHTHTWTVGFTTATSVLKTVTLNANTTESAYPPYKQVIFIQYNGTPVTNTKPVVYNGTTIKVDNKTYGNDGNTNSETNDANHIIQFQFYDDSNYLNAKVFYSTIKGAMTNQIIDLNLSEMQGKARADYNCSGSGLNFGSITTCWLDWNVQAVADGNYFIDVNVYDSGGLEDTNSSSGSFTVDKNAPSTGDNHTNGWSTGTPNVTLTCIDTAAADGNKSGCQAVRYWADQNALGWQSVSGSTAIASFASDGNHRVDFNSIDNAGNPESTRTIWAAKDNIAPVTTDNHTNGWSTGTGITLTCTDTNSGCQTTYYWVDQNNSQGTGTSIVFKADGNHRVDYNSIDNANNQEANHTIWVAIDNTFPTWTNTTSALTVINATSHELSGTTDENSTCKYDTNNSAYSNMAGVFTPSNNGTSHAATLSFSVGSTVWTYYVRCSDSTGNAMPDSNSVSFTQQASGGTGNPQAPTAPTCQAGTHLDTSTNACVSDIPIVPEPIIPPAPTTTPEPIVETIVPNTAVPALAEQTVESVQAGISDAGVKGINAEEVIENNSNLETSLSFEVGRTTTSAPGGGMATIAYESRLTISFKNISVSKLTNVKILQEIPKSVAQSASQILVPKGIQYRVVKEDPILEFTIAEIDAGRTASVNFSVAKQLDQAAVEQVKKPLVVQLNSETDTQEPEPATKPGPALKPGPKPATTAKKPRDNVGVAMLGMTGIIAVLVAVYLIVRPKKKSHWK